MNKPNDTGLEIARDAHVYIEGMEHIVLANIPVTVKEGMSQPQNVLLRKKVQVIDKKYVVSYIVHCYNDPARCGDGAIYQGGYYSSLTVAMDDVSRRIQHASRYSNSIW